MRGKPGKNVVAVLPSRITPAHAGKTKHKQFTDFLDKDHPRACGENWDLEHEIKRGKGSPPRMRGKLIKGTK
mgnify:CR=1 FL=1